MKENDSPASPRESLHIIQSMIETTRRSVSDASAFYLLWGWAVMIACVLQFYLKVVVRYDHHYYAWFITFAAIVPHIFLLRKKGKQENVKTFVGEANKYLWTAIGLSFVVLMLIFSKTGWVNAYPFYILLYGIGTYVSGNLISFRPFIIGGICCGVLAAITAYVSYDLQILMTALAILISYIIPGHLLRMHYQRQNF